MYGEDVDLSRRAIAAGYRPAVEPRATFVHAFGASSTSSRKRIMVLRGKASLYSQNPTRWRRVASSLLLHAGVLLRAMLEAIRPHRASDWRQAWAAREEWRRGWDQPPVPVVVTREQAGSAQQ
jgi:GT2 family glycosyltransferase